VHKRISRGRKRAVGKKKKKEKNIFKGFFCLFVLFCFGFEVTGTFGVTRAGNELLLLRVGLSLAAQVRNESIIFIEKNPSGFPHVPQRQ